MNIYNSTYATVLNTVITNYAIKYINSYSFVGTGNCEGDGAEGSSPNCSKARRGCCLDLDGGGGGGGGGDAAAGGASWAGGCFGDSNEPTPESGGSGAGGAPK